MVYLTATYVTGDNDKKLSRSSSPSLPGNIECHQTPRPTDTGPIFDFEHPPNSSSSSGGQPNVVGTGSEMRLNNLEFDFNEFFKIDSLPGFDVSIETFSLFKSGR